MCVSIFSTNLIFMEPCIVVWFSRNTNKMQLCNRIYYSKVYWRLNMFRAAHHSSSGALYCICSLCFIYTCGDRPLPRLSGKWLIVKPDGCVRFVLFPFGFLISVYIYGLFGVYKFDIHGSVHRRWLSRNTNKMQLCNRIYYSRVYWRLNMFRAAHRSSSGALYCICSLCGDRPLSRLSGNGRSPHVYINQRLQIQFRAPDDERCAGRNMISLQ